MMKVLIIGAKWPPETFLDRLIIGLVDKGVDVTFAVEKGNNDSSVSHPGIRWLNAPSWQGPIPLRLILLSRMFLRGLILDFSMICRIASLIRPVPDFQERLKTWFRYLPFVGHKWDIVYFPWNGHATTYGQFFQGNCPYVVSCRGSQINILPHQPGRQRYIEELRETFCTAAAIHCVSDAIKAEARQYGLDPDKARVIRPAVDPNFFHPGEGSKPSYNFTIISVGSLIWSKGYEYALQAIRLLVDQRIAVSFHIIGDGPERQRILYTIYDLKLTGQVQLHGSLAPTQVRSQLQQADAFLLGSLSEGISNAVLEAMACGLPVVTTDCGGMREAVTDGVEGFVVPRANPQAMAAALSQLALDQEKRRKMGERGRVRILEHFTLAQQVQDFIKMYQIAISNNSKSEI
jgi:colanic acid/amylovoran biosynthesis glycosyltransferase